VKTENKCRRIEHREKRIGKRGKKQSAKDSWKLIKTRRSESEKVRGSIGNDARYQRENYFPYFSAGIFSFMHQRSFSGTKGFGSGKEVYD
jgi:hypothetical protein